MSWLSGLVFGKKEQAKKKVYAPCLLRLEELEITVTRKAIKHLHLRIAPTTEVKVSAPWRLTDEQIIQSLKPRLEWIKEKQAALQQRPVTQAKSFTTGEPHVFLGRTYALVVVESSAKSAKVVLNEEETQLYLYVPHQATVELKAKALDAFYRQELKSLIPPLLAKWQPIMNVQVLDWGVKAMKTRWGTCNTRDKRVWLSLMLAKMPVECIEYVMVHELVHLLERNHTPRFHALMTQFLPNWPALQQQLNQSARKEASL